MFRPARAENGRKLQGDPITMVAVVDERGMSVRIHRPRIAAEIECRCCGRDFTTEEMSLLRAITSGPERLNRTALSGEFCRRIGRYRTDGGLKDMTVRVTMLAMHRGGIINLPALAQASPRAKPIVFGDETEPPSVTSPRQLLMMSDLCRYTPWSAAHMKAGYGTSSLPVITISAVRPW